jgi:hypothetical protein
MKKRYVTPVVEKVTFDYKVQTSSGSSGCFGSVINVSHGITLCDEGTPTYIGWNNKNPGEI